ncbi:reverse transcriptase domain-containing protein [Tanacetum coccineum]
MEDDIYNLVMKGNDLKTYARRFQELTVLCPNMVPNTEKLMEAFIGGLPRSIEGNFTASKPQTLEEAITITQRLMDQNASQEDISIYNTNYDSDCIRRNNYCWICFVPKAQAANMENTDNTNRNTGPRETPENKVAFVTGTLTDDALSWWNAYAQPIGIKQANRTTWTELKRILTNKYCPRTEIKKMEDEFYGLIVKGNDLKTYIRRISKELGRFKCARQCDNSKKLMEAFLVDCPKSLNEMLTSAQNLHTLEESTKIAHRLMDQILKRDFVQETNGHKRKFEIKETSTTITTTTLIIVTTTTTPMIATTTTTPTIATTTTRITVTMITTNSKMEGRKPSGLMETVDIMDFIPYVGSVHCIIQDLALSGVITVTKLGHQTKTIKLRNFYSKPSLHHSTKSRGRDFCKVGGL